ncbi:DinB family protein [Sphingobacterium chuzhouense]|uniref:DinB family protein n=1 Tax=Sphingobacterium chuzhouense TaxID=1742264 RepID=A0ABR7XQX3_9SPHI|nr:DinB family protein [Sphingobacterium chuzhouense]MBD1421550.1 DinB family protein [Sphingobacterium chuzhouense]
MNNKPSVEVWMRGPIEEVPALLQPVAHALLQVQEDSIRYTQKLKDEDIWIRPYGLANIAFHIQHMTGVIDRMFTYADERSLSEEQFDFLSKEGQQDTRASLSRLLVTLQNQIDQSIIYLKKVDPLTLGDTRYLGRKRIPTTLIGLLFHAAEHAQRHIGQLLVTARHLEYSGNIP